MRVEKELGFQTPCLVLQTLEANLQVANPRLMNSNRLMWPPNVKHLEIFQIFFNISNINIMPLSSLKFQG